ncbi:MarR family winged helix-turn-helix transcriptional regulator [Thermoflavimicrobium daqui]|jgi:DNA-binding MarR family transcriptional regulator|uniref:MarR family transcriptional regulator n=1 Tax=Thermoflavimicrobium daqui TaxID=2137476 RepID=A0A364K432_9BACL|nr:MarR family transcriptional regulator [Thermoflavimicrobium daqui]RAL24148.1 MarR family transcriptional regulator [Thermoflavimicrobium daqui]
MEFDYSNALTHLMSHVLKLYRHNVDMLIGEYDVSPGQPPLLMRLAEKDGQIQKELARQIHVKPATLTVMINRMQKAGLVERKPDQIDQRVSRVYLTEKGRLATEAVKNALYTIEQKCFEHFSSEEKILFRRLLQQMHDDLEVLRMTNS